MKATIEFANDKHLEGAYKALVKFLQDTQAKVQYDDEAKATIDEFTETIEG